MELSGEILHPFHFFFFFPHFHLVNYSFALSLIDLSTQIILNGVNHF